MPPAIHQRDVLSLRSWREPSQLLQNRPKSTSQHIKTSDLDSFTSAILHGGQKSRNKENRPDTSPSTEQIRSQTQANSGHRDLVENALKLQNSFNLQRNHQTGSKPSTSKRRADNSPAERPTQRRRDELQSKTSDHSSTHENTHSPGLEGSPRLSPAFFSQNTKEKVHNALQGIGQLQSKFCEIRWARSKKFQCTLSCHVLDDSLTEDFKLSETVMGDGTSKVADSLLASLSS